MHSDHSKPQAAGAGNTDTAIIIKDTVARAHNADRATTTSVKQIQLFCVAHKKLFLPMQRFTREPQPLGKVLQDYLENSNLQAKMNEARAVETWPLIAGNINRFTTKVWIRNGRLYVRLKSAMWRHELHLQRMQWCEKLNKELGESFVKEIVFC